MFMLPNMEISFNVNGNVTEHGDIVLFRTDDVISFNCPLHDSVKNTLIQTAQFWVT